MLFCCIALLYLRSMKWKKLLHAITLYSVYIHHHLTMMISPFDLFFHHLSPNTIDCRNNFFDTLKDVMEISNLAIPSHGVASILQSKKVRFYSKNDCQQLFRITIAINEHFLLGNKLEHLNYLQSFHGLPF